MPTPNQSTSSSPTRTVDTWRLSLLTGLPRGASLPPRPVKTPLKESALRRWIGPLLLIAGTPILAIGVWMATVHYGGSVLLLAKAEPNEWLQKLPLPSLRAALVIIAWTLAQWFLLRFLPGKIGKGPVTASGEQPTYRYNGVLAWIVTHGLLFGVLYPLGILDPGKLYPLYGSILITLNISALIFCALLYIKGRLYPNCSDTVYTGNFLFDFFQGVELYPVYGGVSLKQLINCRVSMMGWSVVFVSFAITQYTKFGFLSTSMLASTIILTAYLFKFFVWERGYLFSLDIMHDRFGYYICWGVLVWVPSVYCLVALYLVDHPTQFSIPTTISIIGFGLLSIWINYNADAQRRLIRDSGGTARIWGKKPSLIHAQYRTSDGKIHSNILLASGWWGISRHFHYIPELALAAAWTLPVGFTHFLPWFYLIFLFILLMDRAIRDEKRCEKKYGTYWEQYKQKVPYRVFPGIF